MVHFSLISPNKGDSGQYKVSIKKTVRPVPHAARDRGRHGAPPATDYLYVIQEPAHPLRFSWQLPPPPPRQPSGPAVPPLIVFYTSVCHPAQAVRPVPSHRFFARVRQYRQAVHARRSFGIKCLAMYESSHTPILGCLQAPAEPVWRAASRIPIIQRHPTVYIQLNTVITRYW